MKANTRRRCGAELAVTLLSLIALGYAQTPARAEQRIMLRPEMLMNECATGDVSKLVDEQTTIGDPAAKTAQKPKSCVFLGWAKWQYPSYILVDLGSEVTVTRAFLYNETGESDLTLSTGKPFAWKAQDIKLGGYLQWNEYAINARTRFLRITVKGPTSLYELALYGDAQPAPTAGKPAPKPGKHPLPTIDQFVGTNGFIDDPIDKMAAAVGFLREYHPWGWDVENTDKQVRFQPSAAAGGNAWFFDDFYAKLKAAGVTVNADVNQHPTVLFGDTNEEGKPIEKAKDAEDPASYAAHAAHLYQYAARFGATKVEDGALKLAPGQPRKSGLGVLNYIENWNEPDKTWRDREGRFQPYELAAMCSADYDGHQGRMGKNVGVKNADPTMRLTLGGLMGANIDYLNAMKFWADYNRNGSFPVDVINVHYYSSDGDDNQAFKTQGLSPEATHMREKFGKLVQWRDANAPNCEVWVTEFGYDTNQASPLHSPPVGSYTAEETQAIWLIRTYMALAGAGIDRAAMFMFRDVDSKGGGVFATCGMVTEKGQWTPKPSYYYIATLKNRLKGMRYAGEVACNTKDVLIYRFAAPDGAQAYVAWLPTSEDKKVAGVTFAVKGTSATRVEFANGKLQGDASPIAITGGKITLDAREKPTIVLTR